MNAFVEDFSTWETAALVSVPPETLEFADLVALIIELQDRLNKTELDKVARSYQGGW